MGHLTPFYAIFNLPLSSHWINVYSLVPLRFACLGVKTCGSVLLALVSLLRIFFSVPWLLAKLKDFSRNRNQLRTIVPSTASTYSTRLFMAGAIFSTLTQSA